ncbi:uncharacterized protein LOC136027474 isoform X2 [Artemia franciscana]|uniref:Protein sleepless n=1 Tax=Artemia franciscana TaxID=6661 RepID=A0AA88HHE7_ARTSF|nr:hypothetical protein QYM36_013045 [Artemia franciscana]
MTWKIFLTSLLLIGICSIASAIDCFKCVSINGDNPACEDPFHNNSTVGILESNCMGGKKGRDGLFPASSCLKLSGVYADTQETLIVRDCSMDSGTLTLDTELVRMSHCGSFVLEGRYVKGCLQSCDDVDGCNASYKVFIATTALLLPLLLQFI